MQSPDKCLQVLSSKLIHCFIFCQIKLILSYLILSVKLKTLERSKEKLQRILYTLELKDCACINLQNIESTYVKPGNAKIQSRIDYIFISKELNLYLKSYKLKIPLVPDHKAVEIVIKKITHERGQLIWKLNTSLLKETRYYEEITRIIQIKKGQTKHRT